MPGKDGTGPLGLGPGIGGGVGYCAGYAAAGNDVRKIRGNGRAGRCGRGARHAAPALPRFPAGDPAALFSGGLPSPAETAAVPEITVLKARCGRLEQILDRIFRRIEALEGAKRDGRE